MKRVAHVITGLGIGGAETFLLRVIPEFEKRGYKSLVIFLTGEGEYTEAYEKQDIKVIPIGIHSVLDTPRGFFQLIKSLRAYSPDLIQTWMYHANLLGGIAGKVLRVPVIWGIQQSNLHSSVNKPRTRHVIRISSVLSRWLPESIIYDSQAARSVHEETGFEQKRGCVVPNGVNEQWFAPEPGRGERIRRDLGISHESIVVGHIARYDVQKDQKTFIKSVKRVRERARDLHVVMAGANIDWSNSGLTEVLDEEMDRAWIHLLGPRPDVGDLYAAMDIFCSSSIGESCPNVVLEAMMMGLPCVATDVGDVRQMLGERGLVVSPSDHGALAELLLNTISLPREKRKEIGALLRKRALDRFTLAGAADRYAERYHARIGNRPSG